MEVERVQEGRGAGAGAAMAAIRVHSFFNPHPSQPTCVCTPGVVSPRLVNWATGYAWAPNGAGRGDGRPGVRVACHVGWVLLGVHAGIGPVWPYRGEAVPGLRVAKAMLALG